MTKETTEELNKKIKNTFDRNYEGRTLDLCAGRDSNRGWQLV